MNEVTLPELARIVTKLEVGTVRKELFEAEMKNFGIDLAEVKESQKWMSRSLAVAVIGVLANLVVLLVSVI